MSSLSQASLPTPLLVSQTPKKQAKADLKSLRKTQKQTQWQKDGAAIDEVRHVFRLSIKEFAAELGRPESQVRAWIEGRERPQIETVREVPRFEGPMLIAQARQVEGIAVDTVIYVRRTA
jgi:DNA-binding transcriptional regulator YiaG